MSEILVDIIVERVKAGIKERLYQYVYCSRSISHNPEDIEDMRRVAEDITLLCHVVEQKMNASIDEVSCAINCAGPIIKECCDTLFKATREKLAKKEQLESTMVVVEVLTNKVKTYLEPLKAYPDRYQDALQNAKYLAFVIAAPLTVFCGMVNTEKMPLDIAKNFCLFEVSLIELFCNFLCKLLREK